MILENTGGTMNFKKIFKDKELENTFIKTTIGPSVGSADKAALNRKGNILFNSGDAEGARRIFLTTGYTDGLARVGDHYKSKGKPLEALRMYWLAPDRNKAEPLIMQLSSIIQTMISDNEKE